ncbi:hypothetical protein BHM03_00041203 [Ensete ventricosum]|nr:hypothetical protein BHM03_00041203 [Ensete ventricosum]
MVKVRMNTADVAAEVKCLRKLIGMRCANVYDISPKVGNLIPIPRFNQNPNSCTNWVSNDVVLFNLQIVVFQFGLGSNAHYVILELYAQGNILLTDSDFTVMTLLRSHRFFSYPCPYRPVCTDPVADRYADRLLSGSTAKIGGRLREKSTVGGRLRKKKGSGKEERRRGEEEIPRLPALAAREPLPLVGDFSLPSPVRGERSRRLPEGYILMQSKTSGKKNLVVPQESAMDKENRVHALKKEVDYSIKMAELIEYNLEDVDAAIVAVRVALANGMNWEDIARMVKEERKSGNPVAGLIDKLHLERNCITLLLSNNLDEMDDDEKTAPVEKVLVEVEVDLALSAHANARRWYELKKRQENKQDKTIKAHEKAFKAAEKKTRHQLAQVFYRPYRLL